MEKGRGSIRVYKGEIQASGNIMRRYNDNSSVIIFNGGLVTAKIDNKWVMTTYSHPDCTPDIWSVAYF
jgi:hypothetical protein